MISTLGVFLRKSWALANWAGLQHTVTGSNCAIALMTPVNASCAGLHWHRNIKYKLNIFLEQKKPPMPKWWFRILLLPVWKQNGGLLGTFSPIIYTLWPSHPSPFVRFPFCRHAVSKVPGTDLFRVIHPPHDLKIKCNLTSAPFAEMDVYFNINGYCIHTSLNHVIFGSKVKK